jgi:hypothetical protein
VHQINEGYKKFIEIKGIKLFQARERFIVSMCTKYLQMRGQGLIDSRAKLLLSRHFMSSTGTGTCTGACRLERGDGFQTGD